MSGNENSRIERMFKDKQDRIARQIALQVAGQVECDIRECENNRDCSSEETIGYAGYQ